jgi:hypothetical protein
MHPAKRQAALEELTTLASTGADRAALKDKGLQLGVPHSEIAMLVEKAIREGRPAGYETGVTSPPQAPHLHGYAPDQAPPPGTVTPYGVAPAGAVPGHPHTQHRRPAKAGSSSNEAYAAIGLGLLLLIGGVIATIVSYDAARESGRFSVWYGVIILCGAISLSQGIVGLFRNK